jgi:ParB family chromosome partitioning protein
MMEFKDGKNTGRTVRVLVTYILEEFAGLEDGYCIMATSLMNENGEPFDRADLNQICADIRANGDGYIDGGEEYIMIENAVGIIAGGKED